MSWLLLAFIATLLWTIVALLDTWFVHDVYADALDGALISGMFQSVPWLLVPLGLVEFSLPDITTTACALAAGALFLLSFFAYFKALFASNDSALMQLLWNLAVVAVPLTAWLLLDEQLLPAHYLGITLAFAGLAMFGMNRRTPSASSMSATPIIRHMLAAVVLLALSMVAGKAAYRAVDDFGSIFLLFCTGATAIALLLPVALGPVQARSRMQRLMRLWRCYGLIFLLGETLSLAATLASQRAISLAPAVSLVAVIESLVPVFVMLGSLLLAGLFRWQGQPALAAAYRAQLAHPGRKALALVMIASGIYVVT